MVIPFYLLAVTWRDDLAEILTSGDFVLALTAVLSAAGISIGLHYADPTGVRVLPFDLAAGAALLAIATLDVFFCPAGHHYDAGKTAAHLVYVSGCYGFALSSIRQVRKVNWRLSTWQRLLAWFLTLLPTLYFCLYIAFYPRENYPPTPGFPAAVWLTILTTLITGSLMWAFGMLRGRQSGHL